MEGEEGEDGDEREEHTVNEEAAKDKKTSIFGLTHTRSIGFADALCTSIDHADAVAKRWSPN